MKIRSQALLTLIKSSPADGFHNSEVISILTEQKRYAALGLMNVFAKQYKEALELWQK